MPNFMKQRRAAVVPLFAIVLPVLMIFCGMAINLAYVQLTHTEMKIAVDAAVHAGGRRLGTPQPNDTGGVQTLAEAKTDVKAFAARIAALNKVGGDSAVIPENVMEFGRSSRAVNEDGSFRPYEFYNISDTQIPSSFRIASNQLTLPHLFGPFTSANGFTPSKTFKVGASSVSTQVDRDVVLVLDRSGSMLLFEDEELLDDTLYDLSQESYTTGGETIYEYRVQWQRLSDGIIWRNSSHGPYMTEAEFAVYPDFPSRNEYRLNANNRRVRSNEEEETHDKITVDEYDDTDSSIANRWYTSNVIYWLERGTDQNENTSHTLGDDPDTWTNGLTINEQREQLTDPMALYAHDYRYRYKLDDQGMRWFENIESRRAPIYSRWYHLDRGVSVFLNVLGGGVDPDGTVRDGTVQKEQVAILPFNAAPDTQTLSGSSAYNDYNPDFDYGLQEDGFPSTYVNDSSDPGYDVPYEGTNISIRGILPTICPYGGTAIGSALREGTYLIRNVSNDDPEARARAFAAKTVVILTDGDNTVGDSPVDVARDEIAFEDVIVHTITFTPGVSDNGKAAMASVAGYGKGKHYHTDSGEALSRIFEEIANNLPTILTQ